MDCVLGTWSAKYEHNAPSGDFGEILVVPRDADGNVLDLDPEVIDNVVGKNNGDGSAVHPGVLVHLGEELLTAGTYIEDMEFHVGEGSPVLGRTGGDLDVVVKTTITDLAVMFGGTLGGNLTLGRRVDGRTPVHVQHLVCPDMAPDAVLELENFAPSGITKGSQELGREHFRETDDHPFLQTRPLPADDPLSVAGIVPGYFSARRRMVSKEDHEVVAKSMSDIYDCKVVEGECLGNPLYGYDESSCLVPETTEFLSIPTGTGPQSVFLRKKVPADAVKVVYMPADAPPETGTNVHQQVLSPAVPENHYVGESFSATATGRQMKTLVALLASPSLSHSDPSATAFEDMPEASAGDVDANGEWHVDATSRVLTYQTDRTGTITYRSTANTTRTLADTEGKELVSVRQRGAPASSGSRDNATTVFDRVDRTDQLANNKYHYNESVDPPVLTFFSGQGVEGGYVDVVRVEQNQYDLYQNGVAHNPLPHSELILHSNQSGKDISVTYDAEAVEKRITGLTGRAYSFTNNDMPRGGETSEIGAVSSVKFGRPGSAAVLTAASSVSSSEYVWASASSLLTFDATTTPSVFSPITVVFKYAVFEWLDTPKGRLPDPEELGEMDAQGRVIDRDTLLPLRNHQVLLSYIAQESATVVAPNDEGFSDTERKEILAKLSRHQMLGEQIVLRKAMPVDVEVRARMVLSDPELEGQARRLVRKLVDDQCHVIGGTFDVDRLVKEAVAHEEIDVFDVDVPSKNQRLSDLAYFVTRGGAIHLSVVPRS